MCTSWVFFLFYNHLTKSSKPKTKMPHTHNTRSHAAAAAAAVSNNVPNVDGNQNASSPAPTPTAAPPASTIPATVLVPTKPAPTLNDVILTQIEKAGVAEHLDETPPPVFHQDRMLDPSADVFLAPDHRVSPTSPPPPSYAQATMVAKSPSTAAFGTAPTPIVTPPTVAPPGNSVAIHKSDAESGKSGVSVTGENLSNPYSHMSIVTRPNLALAAASAHARAADVTEGAALAAGTFNCTRKYTTRKKKLLVEFVNVLKKHSQKYANYLALTIDVPDYFPSKDPTEAVFVLLSGDGNKAEKVRCLNDMLIDWVSEKKLQNPPRNGASPYPAPASLNTMIRTFLAAAKDYYQWHFSQKDFGFDGGYNGFFRELVAKRRKDDVSLFVFFFKFKVITTNSHNQHCYCHHSLNTEIDQTMCILVLKMQTKSISACSMRNIRIST
jgi:hypothetical protein